MEGTIASQGSLLAMMGAASGVRMGAEACQGRSHALPEYLGGRMAGAEGQGRGDGSGRARMPKRVAGTAGSNATGWPRLWALFRQGRQQPGPTVRDLACRERKLGMTGMSNSSRMGTPASTAVPRTRVRCIRPGRAGLPGAPDRHAPGAYEGRRRQGRHRHMTLCLLLPFCLLQGQLARKKQPGPTLCQVAGMLEFVPVLLCH